MRKRLRKKMVKLLLSRMLFGCPSSGLYSITYDNRWLTAWSTGELRNWFQHLTAKTCRWRCSTEFESVPISAELLAESEETAGQFAGPRRQSPEDALPPRMWFVLG